MLNQITNPIGIDFSISQLQELLYTRLLTKKWPTGDAQVVYQSYPRCHRVQVEDGFTAMLYDGGLEYREVYYDDTVDVVSFFGIDQRIKEDMMPTVGVHLVVFANLSRLKPSITHRGDEEVRNDFLSIIGDGLYGFELQSVELGIDSCLREYPGSRRNNRLTTADMEPAHCFRLNFDLYFENGINC